MSALTFRVLNSAKRITKLYADYIHSIGREQFFAWLHGSMWTIVIEF